MDKFQDVRSIPLGSVLAQLGFVGFKKRPGKKEHYEKCPSIKPRKTTRSFSFTDDKFNCFSCGEHGSGAIDLVMKLKKIGFQEAVAHYLEYQANELKWKHKLHRQDVSHAKSIRKNVQE